MWELKFLNVLYSSMKDFSGQNILLLIDGIDFRYVWHLTFENTEKKNPGTLEESKLFAYIEGIAIIFYRNLNELHVKTYAECN